MEIALDLETTGMNKNSPDVAKGHRVLEIACVNPYTGKSFHRLLNPQQEIHPSATKVHGIKNNNVIGKPVFRDVVKEFLQFIDGSTLIIHNAAFDVAFLDKEFRLLPRHLQPKCSFKVIDTLALARDIFPGADNRLIGLASRFNVDASGLHSALGDAVILSKVFPMLTNSEWFALLPTP